MAVTLFLGNTNTGFFGTQPSTVFAEKFMEDSAPGAAIISTSLTIGTDKQALFVNRADPGLGNGDWETGNWTVEVNITTALAGCQARVRLHRYNFDGSSLLESSAFTAYQNVNTTGVKSFTFTSEDWNVGSSVLDRLAVEIEFHPRTTNGTIAFQVGDTNAEVITPIIQGLAPRVTVTTMSLTRTQPTITLANDMQVSPATMSLVAAAPTLDLPVSVSITPATMPLVAAAPTLDLLYALQVTPAVLTLAAAAPTLDIPISLLATPAVFSLAGVAPTLDLPVSVLVTPAVLQLVAAAPTLDIPISLLATPAVLQLVAAAPTLDLPVSLLVTPAELQLIAADPMLAVGFTMMVTPAVFQLSAVSLTIFNKVPPIPVLSRNARFAPTVEADVALAVRAAREAGLHLLAETVARLSLTMSRTAVLKD